MQTVTKIKITTSIKFLKCISRNLVFYLKIILLLVVRINHFFRKSFTSATKKGRKGKSDLIEMEITGKISFDLVNMYKQH